VSTAEHAETNRRDFLYIATMDFPDAEEPQLLVDLRRHPGGVMLVVQIVTGIVLAMHYTPHADLPSTPSSTSCAT
jgi:hypothetical protein